MAKKKARPASKPAAKTAKPTPRRIKPVTGKSPQDVFLDGYAREHATTLRVLRAIPAGQTEFRPHERSQTVSGLLYTMLFEQELSRRALGGGPIFGGGSPPPKPASFEAGIEDLDKGYRELSAAIKKAPASQLEKKVQFPVAKGQMGDWGALDFIWYMLLDQIHHRGQMSVYVRMAGGKVPSIYGPSGDDPWT
ncbi:MAG: DinB family protein [Gemmatimonadaceae bacterium]